MRSHVAPSVELMGAGRTANSHIFKEKSNPRLEIQNICATLDTPKDWSPLVWYKRSLRNPFEFNVKWGGAKVPPLLCPLRCEGGRFVHHPVGPQYSSSLKKKSSFEG